MRSMGKKQSGGLFLSPWEIPQCLERRQYACETNTVFYIVLAATLIFAPLGAKMQIDSRTRPLTGDSTVFGAQAVCL